MTIESSIQVLLDAANTGVSEPATLGLVKDRVRLAASTPQGWCWAVSPILACIEPHGPAAIVLVFFDEAEGAGVVGVTRLPASPIQGLLLHGGPWENELCPEHSAEADSHFARLVLWARTPSADRLITSRQGLLDWAQA